MPHPRRPRLLLLAAALLALAACSAPPPPAGGQSADDVARVEPLLQPLLESSKRGAFARLDTELVQLYSDALPPGVDGPFPRSTAGGLQLAPSAVVANRRVFIDATARGDASALLRELRALGLEHGAAYNRVVSGSFPIARLDRLANARQLAFARVAGATTLNGATVSQGGPAMRTDAAPASAFDGSGVTVGILSDTFDVHNGYGDDQLSGDLPGDIQVLDDSAGSGIDEGRAMAQLVHDAAPGASLAFHTAFTGQANFAQGILDLAAIGAEVIVDDVIYFSEPMFQDGIIAQAVDAVAAQGVAYFSAAGNAAALSYDAPFRPAATGLPDPNYQWHDFDPGPAEDACQSVTLPAGRSVVISFQWDQPFGSLGGAGSQNDLDILLFADGDCTTLLGAGLGLNVGGDPVEVVSIGATSAPNTIGIALGHYLPDGGPTPGRVKYVLYRGSGTVFDEHGTHSATVYGHANAAGAAAVGAAFYGDTPAFGQDPALPEPFTSLGGVDILFAPDGTPRSEQRPKPQFTAPDGTNTTFFGSFDPEGDGFPNFYGTSAAAPHAAAVAALLLQADPTLTPSAVMDALAGTALDMHDPGFDLLTGAGLVQADRAVAYVLGSPPPDPDPDPDPSPAGTVYLSSNTSGSVGGVSFRDEDIVAFDRATGSWELFFDGSDVGLGGTDVNAFALLPGGDLLLSLDRAIEVPGVGWVELADVLRFTPTSLGPVTRGSFARLLDGAAVGLAGRSENVDGLGVTPDGRLLLSTAGSFSVPGLSGRDEDLMVYSVALGGPPPPGDPPPPAAGEFERFVASGDDDAEERADGRVSRSSSDLELVRDGAEQLVGVRVRDLTIPPGATITGAWLQFETDETSSEDTRLEIRVQVAGDAPPFSGSAFDLSQRQASAAMVEWRPPPWTAVHERGAAQRTPDLGALLQPLVDRSDWKPGNAVAFLLEGTGRRVAESYNGDPGRAPSLRVTYTTDGAPAATGALDPSGSFALYFDGSDVGLTASDEDVYAAALDPASGDPVLATKGAHSVGGLAGGPEDLLRCAPTSLGVSTACDFSHFWRGAEHGWTGLRIDGLALGAP